MRRKQNREPGGPTLLGDDLAPDVQGRLSADLLASAAPVAGVAGPGQWLVASFEVASLFSLKSSMANSSVGKSLVIPSFYAAKMAVVDAAFRAGLPDAACATLVSVLARARMCIDPGCGAAVTHTFIKVRQEPKKPTDAQPYIPSIAYREMVHCPGPWRWAFDLAAMAEGDAALLVRCIPYVNYVGKRGSFVQFTGLGRLTDLGPDFTQDLGGPGGVRLPHSSHVVPLDDFGPEATLDVLSSFSASTPKLGRHRKFIQTVVPIGVVSSGPGFTLYSAR